MASSDDWFGRESQHAEDATRSRLIMSLDEAKHRFASAHQLQVRTYLYKARGKYWGKDVKMTGLNDVFAFVCKGLGCSDAETITARKRLYRSLMTEYTGRDYKTPLTEVDFQALAPFDRLQFWFDAADTTPDFKNSPYFRHGGGKIKRGIAHIKDLIAGRPLGERTSMVVNEMIEREHEVALAILYMKLDPASYAPQLKPVEKTEDHETTVKAALEKGGEERGKFVDFSEWKTFPTTLEFDHQGVFQEIHPNFWRYEGGESRSSYTDVKEAKIQLERRFHLVAGIGRYGFNTSIISAGIIFVPYIPDGARTFFQEPDPEANLLRLTMNPRARVDASDDPGWEVDSFGAQVPDLTRYTSFEVLDPAFACQQK